MTTLHAGGKFNEETYKVSGGLHGVGVSVVNALSEWLELEIRRDGKVWQPALPARRAGRRAPARSAPPSTDRHARSPSSPTRRSSRSTEFAFDVLSQRLRELSFLNAGVRIKISDERSGEESHDFCYEGGIVSFVEHLNRARAPLHAPPILVAGERSFQQGDARGAGLDRDRDPVQRDATTRASTRFANNINTVEGGTHLIGFRTALTRTLNRYIATQQKNGKGDAARRSRGDDVREGLTAVISVKLPQPEFEGQTKAKLGTSEVRGLVEGLALRAARSSTSRRTRPSRGRSSAKVHRRRARARGGAQGARPRAPQGRALATTACPASSPTARSATRRRASSSSSRATRPAAPRSRAALARDAGDPAAPRQDPERRARAPRQDALERRRSRRSSPRIGCGIGARLRRRARSATTRSSS